MFVFGMFFSLLRDTMKKVCFSPHAAKNKKMKTPSGLHSPLEALTSSRSKKPDGTLLSKTRTDA
jgi:hypothetical protein